MIAPASPPATRSCPGCGYRFRSFAGERFCSTVCASGVATRGVYAALAGFRAERDAQAMRTPIGRTA